jgi:hypothetical protein
LRPIPASRDVLHGGLFVAALGEQAQRDGGHGVRINRHWAPGGARNCGRESMGATVPTPATAAQLAASITFLLSDDGTNVNGAILASDGGWSAL